MRANEVAEKLDAIRGLHPYPFVMIGLYAGLRSEETLALKWDSLDLDGKTPSIRVRRAWHTEHNRPVISEQLKTKAARRNIPIPPQLSADRGLFQKHLKSTEALRLRCFFPFAKKPVDISPDNLYS